MCGVRGYVEFVQYVFDEYFFGCKVVVIYIVRNIYKENDVGLIVVVFLFEISKNFCFIIQKVFFSIVEDCGNGY